MYLNIEKVIMLEIAESVEVKTNENRHDFRATHAPLALAMFAPIRLRNGHSCYLCVIFFAKIINNTENLAHPTKSVAGLNQTPTILDRKRTECPLPHAVGF